MCHVHHVRRVRVCVTCGVCIASPTCAWCLVCLLCQGEPRPLGLGAPAPALCLRVPHLPPLLLDPQLAPRRRGVCRPLFTHHTFKREGDGLSAPSLHVLMALLFLTSWCLGCFFPWHPCARFDGMIMWMDMRACSAQAGWSAGVLVSICPWQGCAGWAQRGWTHHHRPLCWDHRALGLRGWCSVLASRCHRCGLRTHVGLGRWVLFFFPW
jgi:hypothetical protein